MATAKKPTKTQEATKKTVDKKTVSKTITGKAGAKKPAPKAVIKPKQVKDLTSVEDTEKVDEMDIIQQLLKNSPDRMVPTVSKSDEVKPQEPVHDTPEVTQELQTPVQSKPASKPVASAPKTLSSVLSNIRNRETETTRRVFNFRK